MKILRIYNTLTGDFIRDDFDYAPTAEKAFDGDIPGGFYLPRYDGLKWVEGLTPAQIQALKDSAIPTEPSIEEKVKVNSSRIATIEQTIDVLYGGV